MQEINLIGKITAGGSRPVMESLSVTENGNYTPGEGVDGFNRVNVNVQPVLETLTATENGIYTPGTGKDGFSSVEVDVPAPTHKSMTITQNGVYLPLNENVDYFDDITVNVPFTFDFLPATPSSMNIYKESSMAFSQDLIANKMDTIWSSGSMVGLSFNGTYNLKGFNKLIVDVDNIGTTYALADRFQFNCGLLNQPFSSYVLLNYNTSSIMIDYVMASSSEYYMQSFHGEIDIPANTDCYAYIACCGVNASGIKVQII